MDVVRLDRLELQDAWSEQDPAVRSRDAYPLFWGSGTAASAMVYFELDPGRRLGRHMHTAEEVLLILAGDVVLDVGEDADSLGAEGVSVVPALRVHDVRNVGGGLARCIGFFPAAAVQTIFEGELQPSGSAVQGTPGPEGLLDGSD